MTQQCLEANPALAWMALVRVEDIGGFEHDEHRVASFLVPSLQIKKRGVPGAFVQLDCHIVQQARRR